MKANDSRRGIGIFGSVPVYALPKINSVNELKALVGISSYQGTNEEAFPSLEKLAKRIGLSPAATSTAVSGLVRKDLVGRKRNYGRVNTYFLLYETESKQEIREHNNMERKKARAKLLAENIEKHNLKSQSFESLEYSKVSNVSYSNSSNVDDSKVSNDILKEQLKEHNTRYNPETFRTNVISETKAPEPFKTLTDSLKEIAMRNNLAYSLDRKNEGLFQNKLSIEMSQTNEQILAQAYRFEEIIRKEPTLTWLKNDAFGFKFLQFNWGKIDSWHLSKKPIRKLSLVQKEDTSYYDESKKGIAPTLEQLERMYK